MMTRADILSLLLNNFTLWTTTDTPADRQRLVMKVLKSSSCISFRRLPTKNTAFLPVGFWEETVCHESSSGWSSNRGNDCLLAALDVRVLDSVADVSAGRSRLSIERELGCDSSKLSSEREDLGAYVVRILLSVPVRTPVTSTSSCVCCFFFLLFLPMDEDEASAETSHKDSTFSLSSLTVVWSWSIRERNLFSRSAASLRSIWRSSSNLGKISRHGGQHWTVSSMSSRNHVRRCWISKLVFNDHMAIARFLHTKKCSKRQAQGLGGASN